MKDNVNRSNLGINLKLFREKKGFSARQLSNATGISESHIKNLESASANPSVNALINIANNLDVSLDYLLKDSLTSHLRMASYTDNIIKSLEDCSEHELILINEVIIALKNFTRR